MSKNISRDTDVNEPTNNGYSAGGDLIYFDQLDDVLDTMDVSKYINKNGKLNKNAYKLISGVFRFQNLPNKQGIITMKIATPMTEYIVGKIISGDTGAIDMNNPALTTFRQIENYRTLPFFNSIEQFFIENMKFAKPKGIKKTGGKYSKIKSFINPITKQRIEVNKSAYKKLYRSIILKQITYKELSKYDQTKYDIIDNCAVDFLKKINVSIESIEMVLNRKVNNDLTYEEISLVLLKNNIGCKILTIFGDELINNGLNTEYIFIIHNEHLYVINDMTPKYGHAKLINDIKEIEKYKNRLLIVESFELFKEIKSKIKKEFVAIDYNHREITYKTNKIVFNPMYSEDKKILKENKSRCKSVYNFVNSKLNLLGYLSDSVCEPFKTSNKIRLLRTTMKNDVQYDMNKAYKAQLMKKDLIYPIPSVNDKWAKYSGILANHGFYYCELKSYDQILGKYDDIYFYDEVVELQKYDRIKQIKYEFVTLNTIQLCDDQINFIKDLPNDLSRRFIGWLQKSISFVEKKYDGVSETEGDAICEFHGLEAKYHKSKNMIEITKEYTRKKTGLLINIIVKGLTNIELFRFNNEFIQMNPTSKLNSIKTDSLGYLCENVITPVNFISSEYGKFKMETPKSILLKDYEYNYVPIIPKICDVKMNNYDENDIESILEKNEGLLIDGIFGCGKTSVIIPQIENILNGLKKKYVKCSVTKESSKLSNSVTLSSIFFKKSDYEIINDFKDIDYFIVDERTLVDEKHFKYIEFVHKNTNVKLILIGDDNQIKNIRSINKNSSYILSLCDSNVVNLSMETKRCDEVLKKHLEYIVENNLTKSKKYILDNFNIVNESKTNMNLTMYKSTADKLIKLGMKCDTIMSKQGTTINEPYTIHDFNFMNSKDFLISAISRSSNFEFINILKK